MILRLPVIRVQVQLDHMKPGLPPRRRYEPGILREVAELRVTGSGAIGADEDGTEHLDVHNVGHPRTRDAKRRSGISIMATGDYAALRQRYGAHLTDGIAGESVLVDYAPGLARRAMPGELTITAGSVIPDATCETPSADLTLTGVHVAKPCVEFTRFCLRRGDFEVDDAIRQTLADLDDGARGYKMVAAGPGVIRPGDMLTVDLPD